MIPRGSPSALTEFWPADLLAPSGVVPFGDDSTMRAAFAAASPFIETYDAPWGTKATRLSRDMVRARGWSAIVAFLEGQTEQEDERLASAVRARAPKGLAGAVLPGRDLSPSVVWYVPTTADGISAFWMAHKGMETLLLPPDHGFALFGEGEQLRILAGPPDFLRAAVPAPARMHRDITAHAAEMDRINGHTDASDLLRYYAPVTIDH
jgi:hypothetical protein